MEGKNLGIYQVKKGECIVQKEDQYLSNAPKGQKMTIQTDSTFPNLKNIDGDSVNKHKQQEVANSLIAEKEIGQQQENL